MKSTYRAKPVSRRKWILAAAFLLLAPLVLRAADIALGPNFHPVVEGECYRSGQLSAGQMERVVASHGIRTIINLRGRGQTKDWYRDEIAQSEKLGVKHIDVCISATSLPPPDQLLLLADSLENAPRPILVHCKSGSDRSGLAGAMFLILNQQVAVAKAENDQLCLWYGHLPVGQTQSMNRVLELYQSASAGKPLDQWIAEDYPAIYHQLRPDQSVGQESVAAVHDAMQTFVIIRD